MITAGIDAGSRAIKILVRDTDSRRILVSGATDQGIRQESLAEQLFEQLLRENKLQRNDIAKIVATGYGRNRLRFADETITEITCHACGVHSLVPETRTIIEIGGQDSKWILLNEKGAVQDFAMNDRCAAGTGCFLEMVAKRLETPLMTLGEMAAGCNKSAVISSMCVVFAETEIIGLLASGARPEEIVAGVQTAIAARVSALAGRRVTPPILFTGGVARISGMARALAASLGRPVRIAPDPEMTGALGAAILAERM